MYQMILGTINNIEKIIKYAHKKGAIVVVDGFSKYSYTWK